MSSLLFRVSFVAVLLLAVYVARAQKIDSMMNVYRDKFPEEKIHVHFDKNYYNPGETIWFKAYVLSGINLSEISKNFYAELINDQGVVLQRAVQPLLGSSAAASFVIPQNFTGQYLHFRAFTTWMLNF
ncbi:MAG TPA: hypothetical protein VEZ17_04840, partial [Chitinophagaceae bacterium]|nr:hypothetical protein [Chitinophagaceae bacterium]